MNRFSHRAIVSALAGAIALTSFSLTPAAAAPAKPRDDGKSLVSVDNDNVDVSSQRRRYYRGGGRNDAAAAAAFLGVAGAIAGAAAASRYRRDRYYGDGYYGRGYRGYDRGYYGRGYGGYGGGYGYGRPRYYY